MKALVISLAVILSMISSVVYVNAAINQDVAQFHVETSSQPVSPQHTISDKVLQPAANEQADQTGGNGTNEELQPALGYNALNWNSTIEVQ